MRLRVFRYNSRCCAAQHLKYKAKLTLLKRCVQEKTVGGLSAPVRQLTLVDDGHAVVAKGSLCIECMNFVDITAAVLCFIVQYSDTLWALQVWVMP